LTTDYFQIIRNNTIFSKYLNREVKFDLILPINNDPKEKFATLYMNDGQDLDKLAPVQLCERHYNSHGKPFIWVCLHTNERRLQEYGTAHVPDYKNRGALATDYMNFVILEMMSHIQDSTQSSSKAEDNHFCGFSLGGLSAFDIVWENPHLFSKAGVFSGSFWWRSKSYEEGYNEDNDRIMHTKIKEGQYKEGLKFWFECGTNDETEDRNNNGIIDSIEDTLELMDELHTLGYAKEDTVYLEVKGGEHNFNTWQAVFYDYLKWALD
jgi:enterochelin esterase-like enzyme